jgi:sulfatase modifying factor 1
MASLLQFFTPKALLFFSTLSLTAQSEPKAFEHMVLIPSGSFSMGGNAGLMGGDSQSHQTSYPIHKVALDAFWIDKTEVTNRQFAEFIEASGYVTFAERPLPEAVVESLQQSIAAKLAELKSMLPRATGAERKSMLQAIQELESSSWTEQSAGSIVFAQIQSSLRSSNDITQWWRIDPTATWRAPEGHGSNWKDRLDHPVVNVTYDDAAAYAAWADKRLPTEAEWERAARGGLEQKPYVWGDDFSPEGETVWMANIWQGLWPYENTGLDGYTATAPVKSFPPNAYGLYDISGNVWEIVQDRYHPRAYSLRLDGATNPTGPTPASLAQLRQRVPTYVTRGGSFLCSDDWCRGYQPGSRQTQENDSPAQHTGFRCARDTK